MATPEEMDVAAVEAEADLTELIKGISLEQLGGAMAIIGWLRKWYRKAGYKRLNRMLLGNPELKE